MVHEGRMLRGIFELKKLDKTCNFVFSPNVIGAVIQNGNNGGA
jgi:hypothetical protein